MKKINWKTLLMDILIDIVGGMLIAVGVYNFAVNSGFPLAGISGIAVIFYHFWGIPIGTMSIILNIPIVILCYKLLGKEFLLRSLKTMIIGSVLMDYVAPLLPVYGGNLMLSCICMGALSGLGYAMIYMRNSSTGGADFVLMAVKALKPHISMGSIIIAMDFAIVLLGGVLMGGNVDSIIYGLVATYILSIMVDKVMYGIDAGKVTLIVTEHGEEMCKKIDEYSGRGSTILHGVGSYSKIDKDVIMCACNNKQMFTIRKLVKKMDPQAFIVIMESNEVVGEGFKES